MNNLLKKSILVCAAGLFSMAASAQLSSNPDKFLGNITTRGQVEAGGGVANYYTLWNQITCENESKWASVEGTRNSYNWGCDRAFNYAKQHNFTYKFHALVWGAQYPSWLESLSIVDRYAAYVKWFDEAKKKYATLPMIDVVNEAVGTHQPGNPMVKESLGGGGKTGYDWLIKAFEMAYERWPDAILIYNDYNTFQWNTDEYIDLVRTLRDYGAPVDAYGCQSHDLTDCSLDKFKASETKIQNALKMPMFSTEYDIGTTDDALQLQRYKEQIPYMWEKDYCGGITLWGYIYGATWTTDGNSGIIRNGKDRPAMTWLREYMASDAAKNAKGPYPGMKKEASVYVHPADLKVAKGDVLPIKVRASMATKTIEKVDLYVGTELIKTMTEAPYIAEYTVPSNSPNGWKNLKAVVTTTDGATYERLSRFNVLSSTTKREPYNETIPELPGTIVVSEYDKGAQGVSYDKASRNGSATQTGGWMEYTVDVKEEGLYSFDAEVASTVNGATFHISEYSFDNLTFFADMIEVPKTGSNTNFQKMHGVFKKKLTKGRHVLCLNIDKGGFYIKNITFQKEERDAANISVRYSKATSSVAEGEKASFTIDASSKTGNIVNVKVYVNNMYYTTLTEAPYTLEYEPQEAGKYTITAIATDESGKMNSVNLTITVKAKRGPFTAGKPIEIPGTLQAEYYDKGGEGAAYHDADTQNQGDANYRTNDGVDIVNGNGGKVIGYTSSTDEWVEYTVNVKEAGTYSYKATVSSGTTNSGFSINLRKNGSTIKLADVKVPQTGNNNWDTYKVVEGTLSRDLDAGEQIFRLKITGVNCNIDKIEFILTASGISEVTADSDLDNGATYNLSGQKVGANYKGIVVQQGRKRLKN